MNERPVPPSSEFLASLVAWADDPVIRRHEEKAFFVLTLLIGIIVGLAVVAFILVTEHLGARLLAADAPAWHRLATPVLGALVSGLLLARVFPGARGSGIPQTKAALRLQDGLISIRTVIGKFVCSSLSLASGMALGREGPSVHVGAGIASVVGRRLGLSSSQTKRLVPVGAAAAVAAAFNTPIAAVLFTLEEVVEDLHAPVLGSIVLSSATAWMVLHLVLGDEPLFHVPAYQLVHPAEFLVYGALGLAGGLVSSAFVKTLLALRSWFRRLPSSTVWFQPAIGGLVTGLIGWAVPAVLGVGYGHVGEALNGRMALGMMAMLLVLKLVATSTGYASGNAGGIFGPSLFLGAMMGGSIGGLAHSWFPDYTGGAGAYALVGMGAAFAGIVRVPFTSVVMVFELTRDYTIIVPLMIANMVSYFVASRLQPEPIYAALLHQDGIRLPQRHTSPDDERGVELAMRPAGIVLRPAETAGAAATRLGISAEDPTALAREDGEDPARLGWPVADGTTLAGWLSHEDLVRALREGRHDQRVAAIARAAGSEDASGPSPWLHPDESLDQALRRMAEAGFDRLPVVGRRDPPELLGVVTVSEVVRAYRRAAPGGSPPADAGSRSPRAFLFRLALVAALVLTVSGLLAQRVRSGRLESARHAFETGRVLAQQQRYQEAIEQFRRALAVSGSPDVRLALAEAQFAADRLSEAALYFNESLRTDPISGPALLGLARVADRQRRPDDAVLAYGRAVVANWPEDTARERLRARLEFADYLARNGMKDQALAQLLETQGQAAGDIGVLLDVGRRFLALGNAAEARELYAAVGRSHADAPEAHRGRGEAELALGNWSAARDAFRQVLRLDPQDEHARARDRLSGDLLSLDPRLRRLSSAERQRRSAALLSAVLAEFDACASGAADAPALSAIQPAVDAARRMAGAARRRVAPGDAAEDNLDLAMQIWSSTRAACPATGDASAVEILMRRLIA